MPRPGASPHDSTFQVVEPSDRNLWNNLNFLVTGPPGSGKLTFALSLSRALAPRARILVCDCETEEMVQNETLTRLEEHLDRRGETDMGSQAEVLILRHLHRLALPQVEALLRILSPDRAVVDEIDRGYHLAIRGTCYTPPTCTGEMRSRLTAMFPCEIRLPGMPQARENLALLLFDLVREFNFRHRRNITEISTGVVDEVCELAPHLTLHEVRAMVERSYIQTPGKCLSTLRAR